VAEATLLQHRSSIGLAVGLLGDRRVDEITPRPRAARRPHPGAARFPGFGGDRFRTQITRSCTAVPTFSPHDLRHRRISLLHLSGIPWARIGEHDGQRNLDVTANTYTHVLVDERELDYSGLICSDGGGSVVAPTTKSPISRRVRRLPGATRPAQPSRCRMAARVSA
jgi:hypothetical protein